MTTETTLCNATYSAPISRQHPACVVLLLDQSGSMSSSMNVPGRGAISRKQAVADVVNRLLGELVLSCTKGTEVYDRFHVGVVTYGDSVACAPCFNGLEPLSNVAVRNCKVERRSLQNPDGTASDVSFPIWFEPQSSGGTPMCEALERARSLVEPWLADHPESFPPIIFNITDGDSTDGNPLSAMQALKGIGTQDGPCLLFSCLLGEGPSVLWPSHASQVPVGNMQALFEGASELPDMMRNRAAEAHRLNLPPGARGVVLNAALVDLVRLLDIGTPVRRGR